MQYRALVFPGQDRLLGADFQWEGAFKNNEGKHAEGGGTNKPPLLSCMLGKKIMIE